MKKKGDKRIIKTIKARPKNIIKVMSKNYDPVETVSPGESIIVETAGPKIHIPTEYETNTADLPVHKTHLRALKRRLLITGPICIDGCEAGDIVKIEIADIQIMDDGLIWTGNWLGILKDDIPYGLKDEVSKILQDDTSSDLPHAIKEKIHYTEEAKKALHPFIGTIGVAPKGDDINCLTPTLHGGNMDVPFLTKGSKLYLVAQVKGGMLALGDVHAAMSEGETLGTGVEIGSMVTLKIDVIKKKPYFNNPLIETDEYFIIVDSYENPQVVKDRWKKIKGKKQETKEYNQIIESLLAGYESERLLDKLSIALIKLLNKKKGMSTYKAVTEFHLHGGIRTVQSVNPNCTCISLIPKKILTSTQIY
ncbi:MAG: acetamidase/formamidase family protein [Oscillospiraceae bacterium]|jgi:amidase|nr:acetamidase/formamidase family protein [Oscillospiraceae bacterium]